MRLGGRLAFLTGLATVMSNSQTFFQFETLATRLWYEWLRVRLANNMAYDDIVEGIVMRLTTVNPKKTM